MVSVNLQKTVEQILPGNTGGLKAEALVMVLWPQGDTR